MGVQVILYSSFFKIVSSIDMKGNCCLKHSCKSHVERGSTAVECRTRKRDNPGSKYPFCYCFEVWAFSFYTRCPSSLSCMNEYLAIDSGGNVSDLLFVRIYYCCLARMLPREAELVSK